MPSFGSKDNIILKYNKIESHRNHTTRTWSVQLSLAHNQTKPNPSPGPATVGHLVDGQNDVAAGHTFLFRQESIKHFKSKTSYDF